MTPQKPMAGPASSRAVRVAGSLLTCPATKHALSLGAGVRGESLGARSTVVGFHVVGVQTAKEFPDRLLGSEHAKGRMLPMLRNDLVFALRF